MLRDKWLWLTALTISADAAGRDRKPHDKNISISILQCSEALQAQMAELVSSLRNIAMVHNIFRFF